MIEEAQPIVHDFTPAPIQEPPLKSNKSCLRRAIVGLFTLILIVVIIFTIIGLFFNKPSVQRLPQLPGHFPTDIPLYNFNDRVYINYLNADEINGLWFRLSLVPRLFFGSATLKINPDLTDEEKILHNNVRLGDSITLENIKAVLAIQEEDAHTEKIEIGWENLDDGTPQQVYNFYKKNFTEQDYKIVPSSNTDTQKGFYFSKGAVSGELLIYAQNKKEIQQVILKVNFPSPKALPITP